MLLQIISEDNQNLFDNILNNHLHNKYVGVYDLQKFLKQTLNGVDDISHIFIDIKACKNSLEDIGNIINSYSMIHKDIKFIFYLGNGVENKRFILDLIDIDVFNIITAKEFDKAREELQMCLYGLMTESYLNELLGISLIKASKIDFCGKELHIAIVGATNRVGTTTVAINLSSFIMSCNGKTLYLDMQGDI